MFKRTRQVLKNKNKVQKAIQARRKNEIVDLRMRSLFKSRLYEETQHLEAIFEYDDVDAVIVTVPDKLLPQFGNAIYGEDLASYDVEQVENETNKFYIRRKIVSL
jgi:hypothetical protein